MTQENKELLLVDLCTRLPYHCRVFYEYVDNLDNKTYGYSLTLNTWCINELIAEKAIVKPYLRPISSMTEEEKKELLQISNFDSDVDDICYDSICCIERTSIDITDIANFISWLNAHHFDYRGLIERKLAVAVTKENNPYE